MILEDILVMEVPKKAMQHISTENKLKPRGTKTEDYAKAILSNQQTYSIGEVLAESYRYAGKTSVILNNIIGSPPSLNSKQGSKNFLVQKYGDNLFASRLTPEITDKPKLYAAREYNDKIVLAFTYYGPERRVLRNFELTKEHPQFVDYVVMHFEPLIIEFRAASTKLGGFKTALLEILNLPSTAEWFNMSQLSDREAQLLKEQLSGTLRGAKHKMTEGIYDTKEVKANNDVPDLALEDEYQQEFAGKPFRNMTFGIPYRHQFGLEETITLRLTPDGINFSSSVSEEIIDYVLEKLLTIKNETFNQVASTTQGSIEV